MQLICSNQRLIETFVDKNSLLDGKINGIQILPGNDSISVIIDFMMRPSADYNNIQLKFAECKEYSFSYSDEYIFYNLERVKLLQTNEGFFYVSFDPCDELDVVSMHDQDFILSRELHAYYD